MSQILGLVGFGAGEIVVVVAVIGLLFGATRIPLLMKGLGQGIKEFKDAVKDDERPQEPATVPPPPPPAPENPE